MKGRGTYGIAVFHNRGDVLAATPLARRLKREDPSCRVVWFTSRSCAPILAENPFVDEVVALEGDPLELDGRIDELRLERNWSGFFTPAAYMNPDLLRGRSVFEAARAACGIPGGEPLEFVLRLSPREVEQAERYWRALPEGPKILVETEFFSDQSFWREDFAFDLLEALKHLDPVFLFTSGNRPFFLDRFEELHPKAYWCREPFRLNLEFYNRCDLFVGVSSGISALTLCESCRRDVLHLELVRGWPWGAGSLGRHRNLYVCCNRERFRAALRSVAARLEGRRGSPDFSPLFPLGRARDGRWTRTACPVCGWNDEVEWGGETPGWVACRNCLSGYQKVLSPLRPRPSPLKVEDARKAVEFLAALPGDEGGPFLLAYPGEREELERSLREKGEVLRVPQGKDGLEESLDRLAGDPGGARSFRVALLLDLLQWEVHPLEVLERVEYLLEPGGLLLLSAPSPLFFGEQDLPAGMPLPWSPGETVHLSWGALRCLVQQAGFHPLQVEVRTEAPTAEALLAVKGGFLSQVPLEQWAVHLDRIREEGVPVSAWILARKRGPSKVRQVPAPGGERPRGSGGSD